MRDALPILDDTVHLPSQHSRVLVEYRTAASHQQTVRGGPCAWTADSRQRTVDSRQQTANSGPRTADSGQRTVDSGHRTADSGQETADSGRTVNSRQCTADCAWRTVYRGQCTAANEQRTMCSRQCTAADSVQRTVYSSRQCKAKSVQQNVHSRQYITEITAHCLLSGLCNVESKQTADSKQRCLSQMQAYRGDPDQTSPVWPDSQGRSLGPG